MILQFYNKYEIRRNCKIVFCKSLFILFLFFIPSLNHLGEIYSRSPLFVHHSNIDGDGYRSLEDGAKVEYEAGQGKKGPEATKVRQL